MADSTVGTSPEPTVLVRRDGSTVLSWGPARGSRPPFRLGNMAALKHGACSDRIVEDVAVVVAEELRDVVQRRTSGYQSGASGDG